MDIKQGFLYANRLMKIEALFVLEIFRVITLCALSIITWEKVRTIDLFSTLKKFSHLYTNLFNEIPTCNAMYWKNLEKERGIGRYLGSMEDLEELRGA